MVHLKTMFIVHLYIISALNKYDSLVLKTQSSQNQLSTCLEHQLHSYPYIKWYVTTSLFLYNNHAIFCPIFLIALPKPAGLLSLSKLSRSLIGNWEFSLKMKEILRVRIKDGGNILPFKHISVKPWLWDNS